MKNRNKSKLVGRQLKEHSGILNLGKEFRDPVNLVGKKIFILHNLEQKFSISFNLRI